jgi:hypothetical protein
LKLKAAGMKTLVDITELKIPFLFTGDAVIAQGGLRDKNDALTRFLRAYIEAMA